MKSWLIVTVGMLCVVAPGIAIMIWTDTNPAIAAIVIAIIFIGGLVFSAFWTVVKRSKDMKEIADRLGFTFLKKGDASTLPPVGDLPIMHRGDAYRGTLCLMQGDVDGHQVAVFDYAIGYRRARENGSDSMELKRITVAAVRTAGLALPAFELRPKRMFRKKPSPTFAHVKLTDHHSLADELLIASRSPERCTSLFGPQVCDFFLERKHLSAEGAGEWLVVYREKKLIPKGQVEDFLENARTLARLLAVSERPQY